MLNGHTERDGTGEATFMWQGSEGLKGLVFDLALAPDKASADVVVMPVWEQTIINHKALGFWAGETLSGERGDTKIGTTR